MLDEISDCQRAPLKLMHAAVLTHWGVQPAKNLLILVLAVAQFIAWAQ